VARADWPSSVGRRLSAAPRSNRPARGSTTRTKQAITLSVDKASRLRHPYVGTEHLLVGLLLEGEGTAAVVLRELAGLDVGEARRRVVQVLNDGPELPRRRPPVTPTGDVMHATPSAPCPTRHISGCSWSFPPSSTAMLAAAWPMANRGWRYCRQAVASAGCIRRPAPGS